MTDEELKKLASAITDAVSHSNGNGRINLAPLNALLGFAATAVLIMGAVWAALVRPMENNQKNAEQMQAIKVASEKELLDAKLQHAKELKDTQLQALRDHFAHEISEVAGVAGTSNQRSIDNRNELASMKEKFREIETQFLQISQTRNVQLENHDRFLRMLWWRQYGEELPGIGYFPVVGNGKNGD